MSQLALLKAASTLHTVAGLLQFQPKALAYILYAKPAVAKYSSFAIPKRGGGTRHINAPSPDLLLLQQRLSNLLQNCIEEINLSHKWRDELAHGFKRDRSIMSNAEKHQKRRYVFNIDLQDFFPQINFGRVRGFFIKDANFMLAPKIATILAQIACHNNGLPQGGACSPVISNLIAHILDIRLCRLACANGCTYTRYADDITFSTNKPVFPEHIAKPILGEPHKWEAGSRLREAINSAGFEINHSKTRMQYRSSRQAVTGLVVNRKVNIRAEYRRTIRAMAHRLFNTGGFQRLRAIPNATGQLVPTMVNGTIAQLRGMFGHIDHVDYYNYKIQAKVEKQKKQAKDDLRSKGTLYRRFLMFADFYSAPQPVVVCEGKTDNVYLLHAIKSLAAGFPKLATVSAANKITLNLRILKTSQTSTGRVLRLEGGAGFLKAFIEDYCEELTRFKTPGMKCAIVVVVDNDSAATEIFKAIRKITKGNPSRQDTFLSVAGNLYVVLTPLKAGGADSIIEDCFAPEIRNLKIGGKTFTTANKYDSTLQFGKQVLSEHVRDNAAKIAFAGFAELLRRITAAIEAHQAKQVPPPAQAPAQAVTG